jgi:CBS domain-containing protein
MNTCGDVMTKNPVYCLPTEPASRAAQLMRDQDVGPIPVIDNHQKKKVLGIVTDRDLAVKIVADGRDPNTELEKVMTVDPLVCRSTDNLQSALDAMAKNQVRRIPVVDNQDHLVGIISQADVATRIDVPKKTAQIVHEISKPNSAAASASAST